MTDRGIGDNGGPALEEQDRSFNKRRWALTLLRHPKKPSGAVAMAFKIYMEMDAQGCGAVIPDMEFVLACGFSDRSIRTFKKWLIDNGFVEIKAKGARGRPTEFIARIPGEELAAAVAAIREQMPAIITGNTEEYRQPLPEISSELPAIPAGIPQLPATITGNPGTAANIAGDPPSRVRARMESPSGIDSQLSGSNSPLTPQGGQKDDPLTLYNDYARVTLDGDKVVLHNGLRQYWLERFGGDEIRLDLALQQAAAYLQPNSRRSLETQLGSQLARIAGEKRDRDLRYQSAAERSTPARSPPMSLFDRKIEGARRVQRLLDEAKKDRK